MIHELPEDFVEVLKDIHALQCVQDISGYSCQNPVEMLRVDNQQASIGSRLVDLPKLSAFTEACYLAAYLSACMLCRKVWRHSVMPVSGRSARRPSISRAWRYHSSFTQITLIITIQSHVSRQLLLKLQESNDDQLWDDHPDLLAWMLHVGGSFSPRGTIRSGYKTLLRSNYVLRFGRMYASLPELVELLSQFIWSEKAYRSQVEEFWKEIQEVIEIE